MDRFVRNFVKASLAWFGLGTTLGLCIAVYPAWVIYRPAHLHLNLLGFVAMMIYGVAYHVMPRFSGHPLHSPRLAVAHWWIANAGLALLVTGFVLAPHAGRPAVSALLLGAALSAGGAYAFIWNLWRTLDGRVRAAPPLAPAELVEMRRTTRPPAVGS